MTHVETRRLTVADRDLARRLFLLTTEVFGEEAAPLADGYLDRLLARPDFWAIAAFHDAEFVGGLTAHTLPMTREEASEVFIYDIAVRADRQRQGIGRALVTAMRAAAVEAGIDDVFVPADNDDDHALEFCRALGGEPAPVTIFTFSPGTTEMD